MWGKREPDVEGRLETMIGKGSVFHGALRVEGGIRIDGELEGDLEATGSVVIGKGGIVHSNIIAQNCIIGGRAEGNVTVEGRLELQAGAYLKGDVRCRRIVIDEDVFFEGSCRMNEEQTLRHEGTEERP